MCSCTPSVIFLAGHSLQRNKIVSFISFVLSLYFRDRELLNGRVLYQSVNIPPSIKRVIEL